MGIEKLNAATAFTENEPLPINAAGKILTPTNYSLEILHETLEDSNDIKSSSAEQEFIVEFENVSVNPDTVELIIHSTDMLSNATHYSHPKAKSVQSQENCLDMKCGLLPKEAIATHNQTSVTNPEKSELNMFERTNGLGQQNMSNIESNKVTEMTARLDIDRMILKEHANTSNKITNLMEDSASRSSISSVPLAVDESLKKGGVRDTSRKTVELNDVLQAQQFRWADGRNNLPRHSIDINDENNPRNSSKPHNFMRRKDHNKKDAGTQGRPSASKPISNFIRVEENSITPATVSIDGHLNKFNMEENQQLINKLETSENKLLLPRHPKFRESSLLPFSSHDIDGILSNIEAKVEFSEGIADLFFDNETNYETQEINLI